MIYNCKFNILGLGARPMCSCVGGTQGSWASGERNGPGSPLSRGREDNLPRTASKIHLTLVAAVPVPGELLNLPQIVCEEQGRIRDLSQGVQDFLSTKNLEVGTKKGAVP